MIINKLTLIPPALQRLPQRPEQLYVTGQPLEAFLERPRVAIVGSRKPTPYGRQVTLELSRRLAEQGIVIISGLALGIDALAHQGALEGGGLTLAVLPSPLDNIVPATNRRLAERILAAGGSLISEYPSGERVAKYTFIARNRLVAALADAVLIPEASEKSGSLHTARFAMEQGVTVLAVPGNITSPNSVGTNNLLKTSGLPATSVDDVLHALRLESVGSKPRPTSHDPTEQLLLDLLGQGISDGEALLVGTGTSASEYNRALTMLEISGKVRPLGGNRWSL